MTFAEHGLPEDADEDQKGTIVSNEEWCEWLRKDLRSSPVYATHSALLDECCDIAARWRARFWERKALWGRIRRGRRLAKELAEVQAVGAEDPVQAEQVHGEAEHQHHGEVGEEEEGDALHDGR
jgi:hypothetical protein